MKKLLTIFLAVAAIGSCSENSPTTPNSNNQQNIDTTQGPVDLYRDLPGEWNATVTYYDTTNTKSSMEIPPKNFTLSLDVSDYNSILGYSWPCEACSLSTPGADGNLSVNGKAFTSIYQKDSYGNKEEYSLKGEFWNKDTWHGEIYSSYSIRYGNNLSSDRYKLYIYATRKK